MTRISFFVMLRALAIPSNSLGICDGARPGILLSAFRQKLLPWVSSTPASAPCS